MSDAFSAQQPPSHFVQPSTPLIHGIGYYVPQDRKSVGSDLARSYDNESGDGERTKPKQRRNKPTLSCEECVERKTKVRASSQCITMISFVEAVFIV